MINLDDGNCNDTYHYVVEFSIFQTSQELAMEHRQHQINSLITLRKAQWKRRTGEIKAWKLWGCKAGSISQFAMEMAKLKKYSK